MRAVQYSFEIVKFNGRATNGKVSKLHSISIRVGHVSRGFIAILISVEFSWWRFGERIKISSKITKSPGSNKFREMEESSACLQKCLHAEFEGGKGGDTLFIHMIYSREDRFYCALFLNHHSTLKILLIRSLNRIYMYSILAINPSRAYYGRF